MRDEEAIANLLLFSENDKMSEILVTGILHKLFHLITTCHR